MSDSTADVAVSGKEVWWIPLVMGIIAIVFGVLLISHPAETSIWIAWLVGIWWFIGGVMNLVGLFMDRTMWGWKLAMGIIGIAAGMVVLDAMSATPLLATVGLATIYVFILGIQGIIYGIMQIIYGFQGGGWGITTLGVLSVLFGGFLMFNPFPASIALPFVFGFLALIGGIAAIVLAYKVKKA